MNIFGHLLHTISNYTIIKFFFFIFTDMPLAHIALAVESGSWLSEHAFPLMVMQQLLGSWDRTGGAGANQASKLTQTVAEMELAHSVSSFNTCYKDTGLFGTYIKATV